MDNWRSSIVEKFTSHWTLPHFWMLNKEEPLRKRQYSIFSVHPQSSFLLCVNFSSSKELCFPPLHLLVRNIFMNVLRLTISRDGWMKCILELCNKNDLLPSFIDRVVVATIKPQLANHCRGDEGEIQRDRKGEAILENGGGGMFSEYFPPFCLPSHFLWLLEE